MSRLLARHNAGVRPDVFELGVQSASRCGWPVTRGCTAIVMTRGTCSFWLRGIPLRAAW
jgi:hypothetical protein